MGEGGDANLDILDHGSEPRLALIGALGERADAAEARLAEVRSVLLEGGQADGTARRRALAITGTGEETRDG